MLRRLAYVSHPAADLPPTEVSRIIHVSRVNNAGHGLTGVLVYTGTDFAQVIEGRPETVEALWRKLRADPRHHSILSFIDEPAERAWFETWRVSYLADDSLSDQIAGWRAAETALGQRELDAVRAVMSSADAF
ncbi:MAG: BLUF domain-containing protein [Betaproteobacteria bacterium]